MDTGIIKVYCALGTYFVDRNTGRVRLFAGEYDYEDGLTRHYESITRFDLGDRAWKDIVYYWEVGYWYQKNGRVFYVDKF